MPANGDGPQAHTGGVRRSDQLTTRTRQLVIVSWAVAAAALVALAIAVAHYLSEPADASMSMAMHMSSALYRGGASTLHQPLLGSALITAWQLDAVATAVIVLLAAAYLTGVGLVPIRTDGQRWPVLRTVSFFAGLVVCVLATDGSVAVYDQVLFSAHMLGHLALVMLAPALIVTGRPLRLALTVARPATRARLQQALVGRVGSLLTAPPVALACYTVAIVGTHLTGLMNQIMQVTWAGQLEHLVYLVVGCQFFTLILGDEPIRWRLSAPARWLLLAIAMAVDTFTGVVLIQATSPISMLPAPRLSIDALSDTHTGGAIMWVGGDAIMAVVMIVLVVSWLYRPATRAADRDGWAERARRATFQAHTGADEDAELDGGDAPDDDSADAARQAYNDWLGNLAQH
jgi:putative copper resistance protein D